MMLLLAEITGEAITSFLIAVAAASAAFDAILIGFVFDKFFSRKSKPATEFHMLPRDSINRKMGGLEKEIVERRALRFIYDHAEELVMAVSIRSTESVTDEEADKSQSHDEAEKETSTSNEIKTVVIEETLIVNDTVKIDETIVVEKSSCSADADEISETVEEDSSDEQTCDNVLTCDKLRVLYGKLKKGKQVYQISRHKLRPYWNRARSLLRFYFSAGMQKTLGLLDSTECRDMVNEIYRGDFFTKQLDNVLYDAMEKSKRLLSPENYENRRSEPARFNLKHNSDRIERCDNSKKKYKELLKRERRPGNPLLWLNEKQWGYVIFACFAVCCVLAPTVAVPLVESVITSGFQILLGVFAGLFGLGLLFIFVYLIRVLNWKDKSIADEDSHI